ncbi:efflux RND transporter periplasmic adaptor subunit [bacterium]|nr:efflux RND transporter periplasmic adaptor subunit [bacterium]
MENKRSIKILTYIWGVIPWLIVCLLLISSVIIGIRISREKKRIKEEKLAGYQNNRPPLNVVVQEVQPTEVEDRINLPATIAPWEDLTILAEVSGAIISISVKEGDTVKEGDILAQIDPRDYENRLNQIQASYSLAQLEFDRISRLAKTSAASQAQLDSVQSRLHEISSSLESAKLDLERCTTKAPIPGFINKRFAKIGLLVSRADPLFQILDTRRVKVEVGIPESDVDAINDLKEAEITIDALNNLKVTGKKAFLSRQPESFARVYNLKLEVENPDNLLRAGMFARVNLVKKRYPDSLVVPLYSVVTNENEHYVYVVNDETAHYRPIKLGVLNGWQVQVTDGLKPYERVIVVGQRNLEDGQKVKVIRTISDPQLLNR